jgi:hypothetical protein
MYPKSQAVGIGFTLFCRPDRSLETQINWAAALKGFNPKTVQTSRNLYRKPTSKSLQKPVDGVFTRSATEFLSADPMLLMKS